MERDDEAEKYWLGVGVPKDRVHAFGMKDNFWQMGDTGPCGPCSEVHYDMGPAASDLGHTDCAFGCDCGRYVELWNLVFMQFDRDAGGKLTPLPKPCVDTGMGLERLTTVLQGKTSNYDTDLFTPLIQRAAELTGVDLKKELEKEAHSKQAASLRVIADHARATTFLISDGVMPSNEGRGYVLRKIMRRAIRHGRLLGQTKPFLHEMVFAVRELMKDAYHELNETAERVSEVIHEEERRFVLTLDVGLKKLDELLKDSLSRYATDRVIEFAKKEGVPFKLGPHLRGLQPGSTTEQQRESALIVFSDSKVAERFLRLPEHQPHLNGEAAFKLYDTFGLPLDFIEDAARDQAIEFDRAGFETAMEEQREKARASWKGGTRVAASPAFRELSKTAFEGYSQTESRDCEVLAIVHNSQGVKELRAGE